MTGSMCKSEFTLSVSGSPFVNGNEIGLRQVFNNLILNASQARRSGGVISISIEDGESGQALISVQDNGPGIDHSILDSLFDPFVTNKKEGTGLGLSIVKQIIDQHNGTITASNRPSGGAHFLIVLPRGV
jgi:signal transduction histidine kinase